MALNWKCLIYMIFFVFVLMAGCSNDAVQYPKNDEYLKIAKEVNKANLFKTVKELTDYQTRYTHEKQLEVAEHLYSQMAEYVPNTYFHEYEHWGVKWKNVVGVLPGTEKKDETVIVCAHLDSISDQRLSVAPGADDNASGCSAIMELARILGRYTFNRTVKFVIFSTEETGRGGSQAFVRDLKKSNEEVVGVFNLDMIAYGDRDEDIDLMAQPKYSHLVDQVSALADTYGYQAKKNVGEDCY